VKGYLDTINIDESKLKGGRLNGSLIDPPEEEENRKDYVPLMQKCMGVVG